MAGLGIGIGLGGGGAAGLRISTTQVAPDATGTLAQLRAGVRGTLLFSKLSGAMAVSITAAGAVNLSSALGQGGSAQFVARVANGTGDAVERAFTLKAAAAGAPAPTPTPSPTPTPAPVGFYGGGASNAALAASVSRVRSGSGRARWVMVGDSTTIGQGGGSDADAHGLTGARPNRPASVLAGLLTASGIPAGDRGFVGSGAIAGGVGLAAYHGTVPFGGSTQNRLDIGMGGVTDASLAGSASFGGDGALTTWRDPQCDSFEIVLLRNATGFFSSFVDAPATQYDRAQSSGTGFDRFVHPTKASAAGAHLLSMATSGSGDAASLASVMAFDSTVPAIDMVLHAHCGAISAQLASANVGGHGWSSLDYLKLMAPDLAIINLGLNDIAAGVSAADYAAHLHAIIGAARQSGDVLLVFPPPAGGAFADMAAHEAAAKAQAAADGVAFLSLREHYGAAFTPALAARYYDGVVHPRAEFYAEIASILNQALYCMVAAAFA